MAQSSRTASLSFSEALAGDSDVVARLDEVITRAPFGVYIDDPHQGCIYANQALLSLFGRTWEELAGFGWARHVVAEDAAALQQRIHDYELNPGVIDVRYRVRRPDGEVRWLRARVEARLDAEGRHIGSVGTTEDVTDAETLRSHTAESQKLQVVGRLAGGVAHDFNNLMAAILGSADLLRWNVDQKEDQAHLDTIVRAVEQGRQVTDKLLMLARKRPSGTRTACLDDQLRDLEPLLRAALSAQIQVDVLSAAGDAHVALDDGQVGQLVLNLASNGADAMGGRGTLTIRSSSEPPDVVLVVEDHGEGMDEETRDRMFEPFFTTKESGRGVGLGLSIVKDLVTTCGGSIDVETHSEKGTRVEVRIPRVEPSAFDRAAMRGRSEEDLRGSERLLLIEDHDGLRQSLAVGLSIYGYEVETASSIEEGEQQLMANRFDGVVCDILLPDGAGSELGQRIREPGGEVPWIYVSGFSGSADLGGELERPLTRFVPKPFSPRDVVIELRDLFERASAQGEQTD